MKHKCPAELNSRVIRIELSDYLALKALADDEQQTMATILHQVLTFSLQAQDKKPPAPIEQVEQLYFKAVPVQPVFRETIPVALRARPQSATAENGSKITAFGIKTKGVRYE